MNEDGPSFEAATIARVVALEFVVQLLIATHPKPGRRIGGDAYTLSPRIGDCQGVLSGLLPMLNR